MVEQPSGTVTMLFTDIEGSTKLLQALGRESYAETLDRHQRLLRAAFEPRDGYEVDTEGDAFFVAFSTAEDAVAAAADAQAALARDEWPKGIDLRVRMGIHTGEPLAVPPKYVGIDVHRAARIAAAAHGGQVLVSRATAHLIGTDSFRDLGEHRLKDLTAPEQLYQLGDGQFPPVKSLNQTNLPLAASPLIGRARELAEVVSLIRGDARVITVTGAGGSGKTRLALQAAAEVLDDFAGGVFFVPLAPLRDPTHVLPALAQAVDVKGSGALEQRLRVAPTLLVLDNFEHLLDAAPIIPELLVRTPSAKVLATSRARLRISGEHEYGLDPLSEEEAVEFFLARARAVHAEVHPDAAIEAICQRLDRLPLALELAAARVKFLAPSALLKRLDSRLPLLTAGARDAPERQQTLRATIDWSYDLLDATEQQLLRRLAVFAGSFSLEAAERIAAADFESLAALAELSMLKPVGDDRFLLLETIHEYAVERLVAAGELEELQRLHMSYFADLASGLNAWTRPDLHEDDEEERLRTFENEQDNFRTALDALLRFGPADDALDVVNVLTEYWLGRGQLEEGERWNEKVLAVAPREASLRVANAITNVGEFARFRGDSRRAIDLKEQALDLYRALDQPGAVAATLHDLADTWTHVGEYGRARKLALEAIEIRRERGHPFGIAHALSSLADIELFEQNYDAAERLYEEILAIERENRHRQADTVVVLMSLAECVRRKGDEQRARSLLADALTIARKINVRFGLPEVVVSAAALVTSDDPGLAARLIGVSDILRAETSFEPWDAREEAHIRERVERVLGAAAFSSLRAEGEKLSVERALEQAHAAMQMR